VIKAAGPELTVIEFNAAGNFGGAEPHVHKRHSDAYYLLSGSVEFQLDGKTVTSGAGDFVLIPPETVHGFTVGTDGARFLNIHAPGGFEQYFYEVRELRARGETPDAAFYARHDIYYA
jgi:mannose-6-phosphate isomerase-like protein (cupin superfamily)